MFVNFVKIIFFKSKATKKIKNREFAVKLRFLIFDCLRPFSTIFEYFLNIFDRSELITMEESIDDRLRIITKRKICLSKVVYI